MTKATILFADNDSDFLKTRSEFLEQHGYHIIPAAEPIAAKRVIEQGWVDLAILDLRLINDDDNRDLSGLSVAKESVSSIPKIILTRFPTVEAVREALGPALDGLPPAVEVVAKQEGPEALLTAVRKALKLESEFQERIKRLSDQIRVDYEDARQQTKVNFWASLGVSVAGIVILFVGIGLTMGGIVEVGIVSALAGLVAEGVSVLFFKRADSANTRMDRYHLELLETRYFENLLAACDELQTSDRQECSKKNVIEAATRRWLTESDAPPQIKPRGGEA
jgi:CheY-like chemotaxis protein